MTWPPQRARLLGFALNETLKSADATLIDLNAASGADGQVWTDIAQFANFPNRFTNTNGGKCMLYNPILDRFFSFSDGSGNASVVSAKNPFFALTSPSIPTTPTGITSVDCAVDPATGNMVLVGAPASSQVSRVRSSTDGLTWTARNTILAASTTGPNSVIWVGGTINKFFLGYPSSAGGRIESSPDGATWTDVPGAIVPNTVSRTFVAFSPTLNRILWLSGSSTNCVSSDDGVTWTARTIPVTFSTLFWSTSRSKFYGYDPSSPSNIYSSSDGITWAAPVALTGIAPGATVTKMFEQARLMGLVINSDLVISVDGFATYSKIAEVQAANSLVCSTKGQLLIGKSSDGVHLATMRYGF